MIDVDQRAMRWAVAMIGCEPGEHVRELAPYKFLRMAISEAFELGYDEAMWGKVEGRDGE